MLIARPTNSKAGIYGQSGRGPIFALSPLNCALDIVSNKPVINNGNAAVVSSVYGAAVSLDGSSQYLSVPASSFAAPTGNWTYAFAANTTFAGADQPFISAWDGSSSGRNIYFYYALSLLRVDVPWLQAVFTVSPPSSGAWHRYLLAKSGTLISLYIDGALAGSGTLSITQETPTTSFLVGKTSGSAVYLSGAIGGLRAWNRGLSAREAQLDYQQPFGVYARPARIWIPAPAGTSGAASITDVRDTASATGGIVIRASAAIVEARDTAAGVGGIALVGAAAITDARDVAAATGGIVAVGSSAITESGDTVSGAGNIAIVGGAVITDATDIATGVGLAPRTGAAAIVETGDTASAVGGIAVAGSSAISEQRDSAAAVGGIVVAGSAAIAETHDSVAATGGIVVVGVASIAEASDTATAAGAIVAVGIAAIIESSDLVAANDGIAISAIVAAQTSWRQRSAQTSWRQRSAQIAWAA